VILFVAAFVAHHSVVKTFDGKKFEKKTTLLFTKKKILLKILLDLMYT
jgi:hypothetical protein